MWNDKWSAEGLSLFGRANFDRVTLTGISMGGTAIGAGLSAAGTIAGGNYAAKAGQMQKTAAYAQAGEQEFEAAQSRADWAEREAGARFGNAHRIRNTTAHRICHRLGYGARMAEYEGEQKAQASKLAALGTIAGGAGSMFKMYSARSFPISSPSVGDPTRLGSLY